MPAAAMAAAVDDHWPPLSSAGVPLEAVVASKAQSTQRAAALVLPLLAYKAAATLQGVRLQWYLDCVRGRSCEILLASGERDPAAQPAEQRSSGAAGATALPALSRREQRTFLLPVKFFFN